MTNINSTSRQANTNAKVLNRINGINGLHPVVLVLGGNGFIGTEVCARLRSEGAKVVVGTRAPRPNGAVKERKVQLQSMLSVDDWSTALAGIDVVVNAVGILRQQSFGKDRNAQTYEQIHHQAVARLAQACARKQIRLVHLSALGLENALSSRFSRSKRAGEWALMNSAADWHIVRASLVDGEEGYGARWFRRLAAWPVHVIPANATGMMAPIRVEDLAECISRVALDTNLTAYPNADRVFDVASDVRLSVQSYLCLLKGRKPYGVLRVPAWLSRCCAHVFDLIHCTPLSFGHYELLQFDNRPRLNRTMELLEHSPRAITATARCETNVHKPLLGSQNVPGQIR